MRINCTFALPALALLIGCVKTAPQEAPSASLDVSAVRSVCELPGIHAQFDGQRVRIRGRVGMHAHGVFLGDVKCEGYRLTLVGSKGGPDLSFCTPDRLAQEFGCPGAGNHNGLIVTVVGKLEPSTYPESGRLVVEEMRDFENARTGEKVVL